MINDKLVNKRDAYYEHLLDKWAIPYRIPANVLTDNGTQSVSKFLETMCNFLALKHLKTPAPQPKSNGQAEYTIGR